MSKKQLFVTVALCGFSFSAHSVDYYNAKITGVGADTGDYIRITIDSDPAVILTTQSFTGEQHKRIVALIYAAYATQSPIYFVRSAESSSSSTPHYSNLLYLSVGKQTWD